MSTKHLTDYLLHNASELPDKPALVTDSRTFTWRELAQAVEATAAVLAPKLSTKQQQIVGLLLPNSWEFLVSYLAIVHAGHIAMPLDPNFKPLEVTSVVDQMQPVLSLTDEHYMPFFPPDAAILLPPDYIKLNIKDVRGQTSHKYVRLPAHEQVVSMLFTSGTTGKPKATPYTHANHLWNVTAVSDLWQWTADDTLLVSLPLSHWHGLAMCVNGALYHGNTMYLQERFEPEPTLQMLASGKISLFMHVPIAYLMITQHKPTKKYDISKVRLCVSGSSYLPPAVWQAFKDQYGQEILERYGASEMGLLTSNTLDKRLSGNVGKPLKDVQIRFEPDGQIAMRSPGLFPGYYNNPDATAQNTTTDGWWLSGDIGEFDNDGNLRLKGRVQEKIKKFGYTIYPRDVEWAMLKNPRIKDIVVVGIQNAGQDGMSDKMVYFVVGSISEDEIAAYCKTNLPSFWRPDQVVLMDAIPKSRAGKPKLAVLRSMYNV
jgi:malonyl-CoA/methylmalonyl-CoA synthetase